MAAAELLNQPIGLQRLADLNSLEVLAKRTFTSNKIKFTENSGELLLVAHYKPKVISTGLGFDIFLLDANNVEVITLRRPSTFKFGKVEVSIEGVLASIVRRKTTWFKPVFEIRDANDVPVYRIKGPWNQTNDLQFLLTTLDKKPIGTFTMKRASWSRPIFTYRRDDFTINFPADLEIKYKAACIGAIIYIIHDRRNRR